MKLNANTLQKTWHRALSLTEQYLEEPRKADSILSDELSGEDLQSNGRLKALFYSMLRYKRLSGMMIKKFTSRRPTPQVEAVLLLALGEICSEPADRLPKIIHMVVESSKQKLHPREVGFLNAVLRKTANECHAILSAEKGQNFVKYSHPQWLVEQWNNTWDKDTVNELLAWNQQVAPLYVRLSKQLHPEEIASLSNFPETNYPNYRLVPSGALSQLIPLLEAGKVYIQDPSTSRGLEEFELAPEAKVLDLCAAPGGKSRFWLEQLSDRGHLIAVDLPHRSETLNKNLSTFANAEVVPFDFLEEAPVEIAKQQGSFDLVNLDAPCSNTGVIQRRPDVKERLTAKGLQDIIARQEQLLEKTAPWVKKGGHIIYSTCSLEPQENRLQVEKFLKKHNAFTLEKSILSLPWKDGHDGGATFWLKKS